MIENPLFWVIIIITLLTWAEKKQGWGKSFIKIIKTPAILATPPATQKQGVPKGAVLPLLDRWLAVVGITPLNDRQRMWIGCLFGGALIHIMLIYTFGFAVWSTVVINGWSFISHAVMLYFVLNSTATKAHLNHKVRKIVVGVFAFCSLVLLVQLLSGDSLKFESFGSKDELFSLGSLEKRIERFFTGTPQGVQSCPDLRLGSKPCVLKLVVTTVGSDRIEPVPQMGFEGHARIPFSVNMHLEHAEPLIYIADKKRSVLVRYPDQNSSFSKNNFPKDTLEFRLPEEKGKDGKVTNADKKINLLVEFSIINESEKK